MLPPEPVSSYLTFSPFPLERSRRGGYFLLHYYTLTDIFPLGSMVLSVVRTFLSALRRHDGTACCDAKIQKTGEILKIVNFGNSKRDCYKNALITPSRRFFRDTPHCKEGKVMNGNMLYLGLLKKSFLTAKYAKRRRKAHKDKPLLISSLRYLHKSFVIFAVNGF